MSPLISERTTHVPHELVKYDQLPSPERTLSAESIAALEREHRYYKGKITEQGEVFAIEGIVVPEDDAVMAYESTLNIEEIDGMESEAPQYVRIPGIDPSTGPLATIADKSYEWGSLNAAEHEGTGEHHILSTNTALLARFGLQRVIETGREIRAASRRTASRLGRRGISQLIKMDGSLSDEQS